MYVTGYMRDVNMGMPFVELISVYERTSVTMITGQSKANTSTHILHSSHYFKQKTNKQTRKNTGKNLHKFLIYSIGKILLILATTS